MQGDRAISFLDLVELFVAGQLRVRSFATNPEGKVYKRLEKDLDTRWIPDIHLAEARF